MRINTRTNWLILSLIIQLIAIQHTHAQEWMLDVKPGVKLVQSSFFKSTYFEKKNTTDITFDYSKKRQLTRLCFEPELYLDMYKMNKNWHFGLGFSVYNWTTKASLTGSQIVNLNPSDEDTTYVGQLSMDITSRNSQFMFTGTRKINFKGRLRDVSQSNLTLGIGFNKLYPRNEFTEAIDLSDSSILYSFYSFRQLYGSKYSNHLSLALLIKYEFTFMNKSNGKSLFNLNVSYQQGFSNANLIKLTAKNNNLHGVLETTSLGSGLRIGISKTLSFQQIKN